MKRFNVMFAALAFLLVMLAGTAAKAQCDRTYPDGAVIAHALQDQTVRNFVLPYRQSNFWVETVTVTVLQTGYNVVWNFTPRCRLEEPYCGIPSQIVCADLDCDLNVIAICVS